MDVNDEPNYTALQNIMLVYFAEYFKRLIEMMLYILLLALVEQLFPIKETICSFAYSLALLLLYFLI